MSETPNPKRTYPVQLNNLKPNPIVQVRGFNEDGYGEPVDVTIETPNTDERVSIKVWPDIFRPIGPGDDVVVSLEKLKEYLAQERQEFARELLGESVTGRLKFHGMPAERDVVPVSVIKKKAGLE